MISTHRHSSACQRRDLSINPGVFKIQIGPPLPHYLCPFRSGGHFCASSDRTSRNSGRGAICTSSHVPMPVAFDSSPKQSLVTRAGRLTRESPPSPFRFSVEEAGEACAGQTPNATAFAKVAHIARCGF